MCKHTKDTFNVLDQAAKDLLTELAQENADNIEWPEDHQPKHHPKKGGKYSRIAYDKRTKRYTTTDGNTPSQVPGTKIMKIDLGNSTIHYCYHLIKDEYVIYKPPNEFQAKFVALATGSHIIKTRDVTVTMLLAFATQSANSAVKTLKNNIKEAPTEETFRPKILNYRLYIDLIRTILTLIECIAEREAIVKVDDEITKINARIEFMNNSNVIPKCKQLNNMITVEQFLVMNNNTCIMDLVCQTLNENLTDEYFRNKWEKHMEAHRKTQDKTRLMEQMTARYAHLLSEDEPLKESSKDPETSSEASFISSMSTSTNPVSERPHKLNYKPSDLTK